MISPANGSQHTFAGVSFTVQTPGKPYSMALGADYSRHELRSGDVWPNDGRERCELNSTGHPLDTVLWFAFSFKQTGTLPYTWTILNQMQQRPETLPGRTETIGKPPSYEMRFEEGQFLIGTRGDPAAITTVQPTPVYHYAETWNGTGQVFDMVARIKLHWTTGELQVWRNGVELCNETGLCFGYNDIQGVSKPSWKFGMYRDADEATAVAEFANIQPPTTTSQLSRVTAPPAWHT